MAYSDDAVKSKLSSLNESQDSIVSVAQWIMFHRRHADRTAALWLSRLQESPTPAKRLTLIYLANEVVQQSRARSKTDFLVAFEPVIGEATALAYKTAGPDVRDKLRRVVEVWKVRTVFDRGVQETLEQRLKEIDQQRAGKSGGGRLGGSLFGGNSTSAADGANAVPPGLEEVAKSQAALNKNEAAAQPAMEKAKSDYETASGTEAGASTPSMRAHKLRELANTLATARGAVEESIKMREKLLSGLEKLLESNRSKLLEEQGLLNEVSTQFADIEAKKDEVEKAILQGGQDSETQNGSTGPKGSEAISAPEFESFTPPPPDVESFTPPAQDDTLNGDAAPLIGQDGPAEGLLASITGDETVSEEPANLNEPPPSFEPPPALKQQGSAAVSAASAANDFLENLGNSGMVRQAPDELTAEGEAPNGHSGDPRLKKRKMSHRQEDDVDDAIFGSAAAGLDEDVVTAMLGNDGEAAGEADVGGYGW